MAPSEEDAQLPILETPRLLLKAQCCGYVFCATCDVFRSCRSRPFPPSTSTTQPLGETGDGDVHADRRSHCVFSCVKGGGWRQHI